MVDVCSVMAFAFARLTAETLFVDSLPVIITFPVPELATIFPSPSTSIAEAVAVPCTLLSLSVVPAFKLS